MNKLQHVAEVSSVPMTYAASAGSIVFGLSTDEWQAVGVIGGLIIAVLTYATSCYFKRQHLKLEQRKHYER